MAPASEFHLVLVLLDVNIPLIPRSVCTAPMMIPATGDSYLASGGNDNFREIAGIYDMRGYIGKTDFGDL